MKKKLFLVTLCSFLLVCAGCKKSVKLKDGKEVIASIKGKKVTAEELFDELKGKYGSSEVTTIVDGFIINKEFTDNKQAKEYAKAQIRSLKEQIEAAGMEWDNYLSQYGYNEEKLETLYKDEFKKNEVAKKYIKKDITEEEIKEYYEKEIYGNYTVKHILISPDVDANASDEEKEEANKKAKKEAEKVIKKLDDGEKWKDLVKKYSDDKGSAKDEGLIKDFTKGDVVDEFFNATLDLKDGKYTKEPVESTYGYHVILRVSSTKKPSLKKAKDTILEKITTNKINNDDKLITNTWVKIRKKYNLKINDTTVNKAYQASINE